MKSIPLNLNASVTGTYDQTKTTLLGRAAQKTLSVAQGGKQVVGTPLNSYADTITDAAVTPIRECVSDNGHELQFVTSTAAGVIVVVLYDINETTGTKAYVGKISLQLPNTTHTIRGVRLYNDSGATGWRILITTVGTIAASGGLFSAENIAKADFAPVLPTVIPVATASGQKAVYWHQETGGINNLTVSQGFGIENDAGLAGQQIIVANGLVASPNFYTFNAANAIVTVGALGVTTDWYVSKTGTISGLLGTFLLLNNYSLCVPSADSGAPAGLQGQTCLFVPGSTGFGLGKISELTSGVTTWPSYATADANNSPNTSVAQTPATAHFSQTLQRIIFQLNNGRWVTKKFVNALYELEFGSSDNPQYRTAQSNAFYEFGGVTIVSSYEHAGWLYTVNNTAGQIGCMAFDLRSLYNYDYSAIISPVLNTPKSQWISFNLNAPVQSFGKFYYRSSGFGSPTGGWTAVPDDRVMSAISSSDQIQFKIQPRVERDSVIIPLQIIEGYLITQPQSELSDYWVGSAENSTKNADSPAYSAFRLTATYPSSVPKLYFRAYDDSGVLVASANTVDNPSFFEYSTNNGSSWIALGTIPNTILTTELRYKWASPPGTNVTVSIRES